MFHKFRPDYLIRLTNGKNLVLETKGQDTPKNQTKRRNLVEWVKAVNTHGRFGTWGFKPRFYQGTAYKVSGWSHLGRTAGWKRDADCTIAWTSR